MMMAPDSDTARNPPITPWLCLYKRTADTGMVTNGSLPSLPGGGGGQAGSLSHGMTGHSRRQMGGRR